MMALVERGQDRLRAGPGHRPRRRRRPAHRGQRQGQRRLDLPHRLRRHAAVLRADHEARPGRQLGAQAQRGPDPGRHRDVRDQRARHLRHRRHQHLSGQAEADPVRLPRGRADVAEGAPLRLSGQEADVPVHDVVVEPAEEARRRRDAATAAARPAEFQPAAATAAVAAASAAAAAARSPRAAR